MTVVSYKQNVYKKGNTVLLTKQKIKVTDPDCNKGFIKMLWWKIHAKYNGAGLYQDQCTKNANKNTNAHLG